MSRFHKYMYGMPLVRVKATETLNMIKRPSSVSVNNSSKNEKKRSFRRYFVGIQTCRNMFKESPEGLLFDVAYKYFDCSNKYKNPPTVLSLHDSPGSSNQLLPMLEKLGEMGCTIIAPDFPGHGDTLGFPTQNNRKDSSTHFFQGSIEERFTYLVDFLFSIKEKNIDLLICHGTSSLVGLSLLECKFLKIKAVFLICPANHLTTGVPFFKRYSSTYSNLYDYPIFRTLMQPVTLLRASSMGLNHNFLELANAIRFHATIEPEQIQNLIEEAKSRKPLICVAYTDNDPFVPVQTTEEFLFDKLGFSRQCLTVINNQGEVTTQGEKGYPCAMKLENNTHHPYQNEKLCSELLKQQIFLLRKVLTKNEM